MEEKAGGWRRRLTDGIIVPNSGAGSRRWNTGSLAWRSGGRAGTAVKLRELLLVSVDSLGPGGDICRWQFHSDVPKKQ